MMTNRPPAGTEGPSAAPVTAAVTAATSSAHQVRAGDRETPITGLGVAADLITSCAAELLAKCPVPF